jgi:hypothetical protein
MAVDGGKLMLGALVVVADVLVWNHFMPRHADMMESDAFNPTLEKSERTALLTGTVLTLGVAGLARSLEVFALGGITLAALSFAAKYANAINPATGKMNQEATQSESFPLPDYNS